MGVKYCAGGGKKLELIGYNDSDMEAEYIATLMAPTQGV
jgi:hypothetical protein